MSNRINLHNRTLKAIIFDLDGTIAETEDAHRAAFNRAFADAGLDWSWDPSTWSGLLEIAGGRNRLTAWLADNRPELLQGPEATHLLDTLHGAKDRLYREILEAGEIPLRPGIRELMDEARANGVKIAIATTSRRAIARRVVECCLGEGAMRWFDAFLGHEDATYRKPHPDIYRRAAAVCACVRAIAWRWRTAPLALPARFLPGCLSSRRSTPTPAIGRLRGRLRLYRIWDRRTRLSAAWPVPAFQTPRPPAPVWNCCPPGMKRP